MMNQNVFGLIGINAKDANWNADENGYPRKSATAACLKEAMRQYWNETGKRVLSIRGNRRENKTFEGRYEEVFGEKVSEDKAFKNILTAVDCRQFGFSFDVNGYEISQRGVSQIGCGININSDTKIKMGNIIMTDQANYCYPFSIWGRGFHNFKGLDSEIKDYSEEDYKDFIAAAAICADRLKSYKRRGCRNEYLLVVETDKDVVNHLDLYVLYNKGILNVQKLEDYLGQFRDRIKSAIIYINQELIQVEGCNLIEVKPLSLLQGTDMYSYNEVTTCVS